MKLHIFTCIFLSTMLPCLISAAEKPTIQENSFQTDCPLIRAERPFQIRAVVENDAAAEFECRLTIPDSCKVSEKLNVSSNELTKNFTWNAVCYTPGQVEFSLELFIDGKSVQKSTIMQAVLPPRKIEKLDYIPEPKPVKTELLVGAHNCPLWERDRADLWNQVVKKHQERTPALGIYSQDNPELADWETKWAVEHGVSYFIYCWYRTSQGGPVTTMFEQSAFDDALFKSRFGSKMKFTIMWENQRRGVAGIDDEKDLLENIMPYWIEKFFKRDNYLKIDNKPVLFVYQPNDVSLDLGDDVRAKAAFEMMREACKDAGFDGLYILGEYRGTDVAVLQRFKNLGLDAVFAYCWYIHNSPPPEIAIQTQLQYIQEIQKHHDILPQVITLSQAWSGWKDEGTIWKIPPKDYETLLRKGKEFIETNMSKDELGGKMLILDNWNEWSEGHYIAPYREYGFGYLDAVRRVFSDAPEDHVDLIPQDIGLGPYDLPKELFENRTSWTFHGSDYENWKLVFSPSQDWRAMMNVKDYRQNDKCLTFESTTFDPAIWVPQDRTRAAMYRKFVVRMKTSVANDDLMKLYWKIENGGDYSETNSAMITVKPSNDFVDYELPLTEISTWKGRIMSLRLDPVTTSGIKVEIEHIRLE